MAKELKEYVVEVQRISYGSHTRIVHATSPEEAKQFAIDYVSENVVIRESSCEYIISFCEEQ